MHRFCAWLCALLATLAPAAAMAAGRGPSRVPEGFAGVVLDGPLWPRIPDGTLDRQLDLMVANGVETVRAPFTWAAVQPYRRWRDVPPGQSRRFINVDGLPLDLTALDALVTACAHRGLALAPVVLGAPGWDALPMPLGTLAATPAADAPYGRFLAALIARYGPHGSLWKSVVPRLPIETWQVWNEPNLPIFWVRQPNFAASYVSLLRVAHAAIKGADPEARVVLAGLPNASWRDVAQILRVPGAARLFDVAAVHPYTRHPPGVLTILERFRTALDHGGATGRPIIVDEFGWNSSLHHSPQHFGSETTEHGQAVNLGQAIDELSRARRPLHLVGFDYDDWAGAEYPGAYEFNFAGLMREVNGVFTPKPALAVYRHAVLGLERCRRKAADARRCARRA